MEFRFSVNEIFHQPIIEISHTLIPAGFKGDRRQLWDTISKVTDVVNAMGAASANAQGLTRAITTSDRMRNSDQQILYLLIDQAGSQGRGAVSGMLKTGRKALYVFDRDGHHYQVQAPCILDFYVHESRQRSGLGKKIFEYMLQREGVEPKRLAIDRPSDKFLAFLNKHYALASPIRQMNNFVVYDGFFPKDETKQQQAKENGGSPHKTANGLQAQILTSPYGRYGAPRPPCSMGQIIHNQSSTVTGSEQTGAPNSFPQFHEAYQIQGQRVDRNGNCDHPRHADQPLQQNEVSATSDGAPTCHPNNQSSYPNPQAPVPAGNTDPNAQSVKFNVVKVPAVSNGITEETEKVRLEKLARDNTAPMQTQSENDVKTENYWPFSYPSQDYIYDKGYIQPPIATLSSGMHKILQPDQYILKQQVGPAKEELDRYGKPVRVASAPLTYHNHQSNHHQQNNQCHKSQSCIPYQPEQNKWHQHYQHNKHYHQPQVDYPRNCYNNVTSYCYYGPRHPASQPQFSPQYVHNDQQLYQQQMEQHYHDQMQRQQEQQMWENYQNWWYQQQCMAQYPQWTQRPQTAQQTTQQYTPQATGYQTQPDTPQPPPPPHALQAQPQPQLQQPENAPSTQQVAQDQQEYNQPQEIQPVQSVQQPPTEIKQPLEKHTMSQPEIIQPEKLLAQEPVEQALRPYYMPHKQNTAVIKQTDKDVTQAKSVPTQGQYIQRTMPPLPYTAPVQPQQRQYQPMPQQQYSQPPQQQQSQTSQQQQQRPQSQISTPNMIYAAPPASKVNQSVHDICKPTWQENAPITASSPSVHKTNAVPPPMQQQQQSQLQQQRPPSQPPQSVMPPPIIPLSPEQIAQLSPQQQVLYYQQMLAQPYLQQGVAYHPYNPVFGVPPQQMQPQASLYPPIQEVNEVIPRSVEQKDNNRQQYQLEESGPICAAGDVPNPPQQREKIPSPYPFPIIMKSSLEPLQPSVPLRRHSKPDVPSVDQQQMNSSRNKMQERPAPLQRPTTAIPSARLANVYLKGTINLASKSNYDIEDHTMRGHNRTPKFVNVFDHCGKLIKRNANGNKMHSQNSSMVDNRVNQKRPVISKEFLEE